MIHTQKESTNSSTTAYGKRTLCTLGSKAALIEKTFMELEALVRLPHCLNIAEKGGGGGGRGECSGSACLFTLVPQAASSPYLCPLPSPNPPSDVEAEDPKQLHQQR